MPEFIQFKTAVQEQFRWMHQGNAFLFTVDIDKDALWELYLKSFPEGTNPIFQERTEHDCQCCKSFIRNYGGIVSLNKRYELVSIWDVEVPSYYQVVADALSKAVKSAWISNQFLNEFSKLGTDFNRSQKDGEIETWTHFFLELPAAYVVRSVDSLGSTLSSSRADKDVLQRSLEELTVDAAETVLELIDQNSLYRGEEHQRTVATFLKLKKEYERLPASDLIRANFCWAKAARMKGAGRFRNTAIGTLLIDLSEGKELDQAVRAFESVVAPQNYKRPNAIITKKMLLEAKAKVAELGFQDSLTRRFAVKEDLTINNVLFANRDTRAVMAAKDVFEELGEKVQVDPKKFNKVEEVTISDFVENIMPHATSLELMVEPRHEGNLVSLIAPEHPEAKSMFKWSNGFSWAYAGNIADSIKQRVKQAGGDVTGVLRCSLAWFNTDDQDIHVIEPSGNRIYYSNKGRTHSSSGKLDVDMNVNNPVVGAVENITWTDKNRMQEGRYQVIVHNFTKRSSTDFGFEVEIEYEGEVTTVYYDKPLRNNREIVAAEFTFSREEGIKFTKTLGTGAAQKELRGVTTGVFQPVSMVMYSPNHWDGEGVGNRHYFFMLEGCKTDEPARGFFNEFLREDLMEHKRVFEALGGMMKAEPTDNQLSGLGFSSTQRNSVLCKVEGSFSRVVKIKF